MKLSDSALRKEAVDIVEMRVDSLIAAATTVKTAAQALITGDVDGQFADATELDTAVAELRDQYYALTVSGLGDVTDLFDITLPEA